jgi:hypothetical protein
MVTPFSKPLGTISLVALVLAAGCDPATSTTAGRAEPASPATSDSVLVRRIARECVLQCDTTHGRGSEAHLRCARHCLAAQQGEEAPRELEEDGHSKAHWAILFAVTISSALALLATLF